MKMRNMYIFTLVLILIYQSSIGINASEVNTLTENTASDKQGETTTNSSVDINPPSVSKVEVSKPTYQAGETVQVSVTATDDVSGVRDVLVYIQGPDGVKLYNSGYYDSSSGKWIASIPLSEYVLTGEWGVPRIVLWDKAGHQIGYDNGNGFTAEGFNVESSLPLDIEPPSVSKVEVSEPTYRAGETVQLSVTATDDVSGVRDVLVYIQGPDGVKLYNSGYYDSSSGKWIASIPLSEHALTGEWGVPRIVLWDKAGHQIGYDNGNGFTAEGFNVESSLPLDIEPPSVSKVEVSKPTYRAGETVQVSVTATDDVSGVRDVLVYIQGPDGVKLYNSGYYDSSSGKWIASIPLSEHALTGEWGVPRIVLWDKAGHQIGYDNGNGFTAGVFNVEPKGKVQSVNITTDKVASQVVGTPIKITATSQGSSEPEYRFFVRDEKGVLTTLQGYGANNATTWTPTKSGVYTIIVHAKDKNSGVSYESRTEMQYQVAVGKITGVSVGADKTSPQDIGTPIKITATSQGSSEPEYRFFVRDEKGVLTTLQGYGANNATTWTPTKSGTYTIIVHARDKNSGANYESRTEMRYQVELGKVMSVSVSTDKASSQGRGTPIKITATSQGSSEPEYRFFVRDEKGVLTTLQGYGANNATTWTPTESGFYTIIVHAKDKNSGVSYESRTELRYQIKAGEVTSVSVSTDKTSPQDIGTPIKITATSQGSSEPEYRFFVRDEKGVLIILQGYGVNNTTTWTPTKPGSYAIIVHARDRNSGMNYESRAEMYYRVQ